MNRWISILAIVAGVALLALAVHLDFRDGSPTMRKGDQPLEVVVVGALGLVSLGHGLYWLIRSFRRRKSDRGDQ